VGTGIKDSMLFQYLFAKGFSVLPEVNVINGAEKKILSLFQIIYGIPHFAASWK
jgi:hypothetical protein